jgi:hypothetical protein
MWMPDPSSVTGNVRNAPGDLGSEVDVGRSHQDANGCKGAADWVGREGSLLEIMNQRSVFCSWVARGFRGPGFNQGNKHIITVYSVSVDDLLCTCWRDIPASLVQRQHMRGIPRKQVGHRDTRSRPH